MLLPTMPPVTTMSPGCTALIRGWAARSIAA